MGPMTYNPGGLERRSFAQGYVFGAPVKDLGWFASLLMGLAVGMTAFFLSTFVAIFSILFWNAAGHKADFTVAYRLVGLPIGIVGAVLALGYLGMFWAKRKLRKG